MVEERISVTPDMYYIRPVIYSRKQLTVDITQYIT
jgi:hypothetical protein